MHSLFYSFISLYKFIYSPHLPYRNPTLCFQCDIQQLHILLVLLICQCTFHQFEVSIYGFTQFFTLFSFFCVACALHFVSKIIRNISNLLHLTCIQIQIFAQLCDVNIYLPIFTFYFSPAKLVADIPNATTTNNTKRFIIPKILIC